MESQHDTSDSHEQLKMHILATAMSAFAVNGIRSVTMDSIARTMRISKRTLYEVFEDKEALLLEGVRVHKEKMHEEMRAFAQKNDNVLEIILHFFECSMEELKQINPQFHIDMNKYPNVLKEMRKQRKRDDEQTVLMLKKGVEQGIFRSDVRFDIVCNVLSESLEIAFRMTSSELSVEQILRTILPVWIRGISTPKGHEILDKYLDTHCLGEGSVRCRDIFSAKRMQKRKG